MSEVCPICKEETSNTEKVPIEQRKRFVDTGEQLCKNCYRKVYGKK